MRLRADRAGWIAALAGGVIALMTTLAAASDLVGIQPLTDRIVMLHFNDGYVQHHQRGQPRSEEKVFVDPLDVVAASRAQSYVVTSTDDPAYGEAKGPQTVSRKSKGTDFAWFVDKWENGRAINTRPDHTEEHWLYLGLPTAMQPGRTYTVSTGTLAKNGREWKLKFDITKARSEAVHVNTLGYVPDAPQKYAYVYHWLGDGGPLELKTYEGRPFHLVETSSGSDMFTGQVRFRMGKDNPETAQKSDSPPYGNFLGADVWECDFSGFHRPGAYVVAVEGIGCSWPFRIDPDVYRPAFVTVARALYHNRSGIALRQPYTEFERPAPHHPKLTPGFAGKLRYTRVRWPEWGSEGGDAEKLMADSPGPLEDTWGWYQDAGDWDSYYTHLRVAQELLLVYEMGPGKFRDGELNLPESGNGVPDILDEAAWLPRFCQRLRAELMAKGWGTGGVGLRVAGDAFGSDEGTTADGKKVGRGSWEDTDRIWMVSGEDPWSTYRYAGTAAHLAYAYQLAGVKRDPAGVDWEKEAREAYAWAKANTRQTDETALGSSLRHPRVYAAACLFRLTGEESYESQLAADTQWIKPDTILKDEAAYGPFVYALGGGKTAPRPEVLQRLRAATLSTADLVVLSSAAKRALRWGGDFYMPMLIGQQTTPLVLPGAVAYTLTRAAEPDRARRYLAALYTTCDYFLGCNSLNQTWVTGLGPRYPAQIFHMDAWYNGRRRFHPGLIPYSPWRKDKEQDAGPWDHAWPYQTLHPDINAWPGNERWFSNRCSPMGSEFTIHQNIGPAAAIFGFLCGESITKADGDTKGSKLTVAGVTVIPHVGTPGVCFRQPPLAPMDIRVQVFLHNRAPEGSGTPSPFGCDNVLFNSRDAVTSIKSGLWSWHDSPQAWNEAERRIPSDALVVWTFNSIDTLLGHTLRIDVNDREKGLGQRFDIPIPKPDLWLSALTFRGPQENPYPDRMIFYVRNETPQTLRLTNCRLFLPRKGESWRFLYAQPWLSDKLTPFSDGGRVEPGELSGAFVSTGPLPLTYAAIQVQLQGEDGSVRQLYAYLRIKKEAFDISGGWVNRSTPKGPTLSYVPFLKTLRRMHVNTAHIGDVPGYTDQTGPEGLYTQYPLKYFNHLSPIEQYDTDALLPRIHAVEFLGEPQYQYGRNGKLPQQVWETLLPYTQSRLATTLTLSESQNWHLYAGLADYPHYDAYRVTAPSPDAWAQYDRWGGSQIRWGAPPETIGIMTRSLRENSRPGPIAYWSQGAHAGWGRYGGRARTSPTPDELRLQAYQALSSRITSLYWFNLSLESLVKFRDLIDEMTRINREIRMLDRFYLEGAAYDYQQVQKAGKPDWDLASVAVPQTALLFALDLAYEADATEKLFRFGPPRAAHFDFTLPSYLREPKDVFRIDADGIQDVAHQATARGMGIDDRVSRVGIYVATKDPSLRAQVEARRQELIRFEESDRFDPARSEADFEALRAFIAQKSSEGDNRVLGLTTLVGG